MKWEWFFLSYVLWGFVFLWPVLLAIFFLSKRKNDHSDCSVFFSFFKHWSLIPLIICSFIILGLTIFSKSMVIDLLETQGYRLVVEIDGLIGIDSEVEYDSYWRDNITILNSCVNHENKLVFVHHSGKGIDSPPKTLEEIQFILEG